MSAPVEKPSSTVTLTATAEKLLTPTQSASLRHGASAATGTVNTTHETALMTLENSTHKKPSNIHEARDKLEEAIVKLKQSHVSLKADFDNLKTYFDLFAQSIKNAPSGNELHSSLSFSKTHINDK